MRRSVWIVSSCQSGNKLLTNLHQGLPWIGSFVARWCCGPIGRRDRHLTRANVRIRVYFVLYSCPIGSDTNCHFLGRWHGLALTHASSDGFHFLHEAVETRTADPNLATAAVENSCRQRTLERQHRKHALLDGALCHEIDDLHRPRLAHAMDARDTLFEDRRIPRQVHVHERRSML